LTRSRMLMQMQADLLQTPVEVYPSPHATAIGVAALARLGVGDAKRPADAVGEWQPAAVFEPRMRRDEAESRLHRWRQVAEATMNL
jgi:glycerol kinase